MPSRRTTALAGEPGRDVATLPPAKKWMPITTQAPIAPHRLVLAIRLVHP